MAVPKHPSALIAPSKVCRGIAAEMYCEGCEGDFTESSYSSLRKTVPRSRRTTVELESNR
jgi:hypothetical protein